jgi:hypothetical protein
VAGPEKWEEEEIFALLKKIDDFLIFEQVA